jgi:hypothetical protein
MPVLLIAAAELPGEAYAEMGDKMAPLIRLAIGRRPADPAAHHAQPTPG